MPSMNFAAAGLLALSSMAAAFPQGGFSNGTAGAVGGTGSASAVAPVSTGTSSSSDPVTEAAFCPKLSGSVIQSKTGISQFLLNCNTNYFGTVITVSFNSTAFVNKRQAAVAPANIQDCLAACDTVPTCVGTAFDTAARTCALYSQIGAAYPAVGTDFAVRVATGAPTTATAGQVLTSTAYSTTVRTISSCAPAVTNCPANLVALGPVVVTQVVPVSSTTYICPALTTLVATPVACNCAYASSTATVYTMSGTSAVVVKTTVIAVPSGSATAYTATTVVGTGSAITTAPKTVGGSTATGTATATTTGGLVKFTGAASNVKAGMGLVAGVAGLAFML